MITRCAQGFFEEKGIDKYQFSGEHEYYKDVLERIYRPLVEHGLLAEMENNNYKIPKESRLRDICRKEIDGKAYIIWEDFRSKYLQQDKKDIS
jgi:hypothetical protein